MLSALWEWVKSLFEGKSTFQVGNRNQSVSGITASDVAAPMTVGNHNVVNITSVSAMPSTKQDDFQPTPVEVEILEKLECSESGSLTLRKVNGFAVQIDGGYVGGPYDDRPDVDVQVHEAVERLRHYAFLSDIQQDGHTYHLSSKGRAAAQQVQMPRGVKAARQTVATLLRKM